MQKRFEQNHVASSAKPTSLKVIALSALLCLNGLSLAQAETAHPSDITSTKIKAPATPTAISGKAPKGAASNAPQGNAAAPNHAAELPPAAKADTVAPANMLGSPVVPIKEEGGLPEGEYADVLDWVKQTKFHGNLRSYFFAREESNSVVHDQTTASGTPLNQNSFSLGGYAGLITAPLYGLQAGLTLGAANSLGLNPKGSAYSQIYTSPTGKQSYSDLRTDLSLPGGTFYVLKEGFLQYTHKYFKVRGPDQIIDTPWIMPSDSRMAPSAFRGVYAEAYPFQDIEPLKDISFVGLRLWSFNGRSDTTFVPNNLYMTGHMQGQVGLGGLTGVTTPGAMAVGMKFTPKDAPYKGELWYNQFYDFSNLLWFDGSYKLKTGTDFTPLFGFQFADQSSTGTCDLCLATAANSGQGATGTGAANTQAYGALLGVDTPWITVTAAYNNILAQRNTFQNGNLISPYSWGYSTDPLYTTQMINGLIEKNTAGQAWKMAATSYFMDKQIKAMLSYAQYYLVGCDTGAVSAATTCTKTQGYTAGSSYLNNTSNETNIDVTYFFAKASMLDGLSVRNRMGVAQGNSSRGHDWYERFQIQYQF